jgi:hypothetical protein
MHFATRVRTWRVARLYSETALSRKPFGIGHMYIYTFLLRITDIVISQNADVSSCDTLYSIGLEVYRFFYIYFISNQKLQSCELIC